MAIRSTVQPEQIVTAEPESAAPESINQRIGAVSAEEVVVGLGSSVRSEYPLRALRILDRSPEVGAIMVNGPEPLIVFRKAAFESVGGFKTDRLTEQALEDLYLRIKSARQWSVICAYR